MATLRSRLGALQRWGYVVVAPPDDGRPAPAQREWVVRLTPAGRRAQAVWRPLPEVIEARWRRRFGEREIEALRASLGAIVGQLEGALPDYLPILGYGFRAESPRETGQPSVDGGARRAPLPLFALLSKVLLAFTLEFERASELSLALSADVLRVLDTRGVRTRDLPVLTGVSKEAIRMALGFLDKRGDVRLERDPPESRATRVVLTPKGREAQDAYRRLLSDTERRWEARFGADKVARLRSSLKRLVEPPAGTSSPLSAGLAPHPGGWRARRPYLSQTMAMIRDARAALPHFPLVLHRGGFPDSS